MAISSYKEDYSVLANYSFFRSLDGITWEPVYGYTDSELSTYFPNMTKVSNLQNAIKNTRVIKFNDIYLTINTVEKDVMYSTDMVTWNTAGIELLRSGSSTLSVYPFYWIELYHKLFLFIAIDSKEVYLFSSTNGTNWSQEDISYNGNPYLKLTYSNTFHFNLVDFADKNIAIFENSYILETQDTNTFAFEKNTEIMVKIAGSSLRSALFVYKVSKPN